MIRRPPRSTPFPTRRSSDLADQAHAGLLDVQHARVAAQQPRQLRLGRERLVEGFRQQRQGLEGLVRLLDVRSEEHTSELQSRQYLVCRLLLEKKNKQF